MDVKQIGIIKGEGIGPEIMNVTQACLEEIRNSGIVNFEFINYDGPYNVSKETYLKLRNFYNEIKESKGVILRASFHAQLVYRLRREFNLLYKLVFLNALPELSDISPLKENVAKKVDILLIRDNNCGPYHGHIWHKYERKEREAWCKFNYSEQHISDIANISFNWSMKRKKKISLFIKKDVLGELGKLWITIFQTISRSFPEVFLEILSPDVGSSEIFVSPGNFDVIVTLDVEGDLLSDQIATLLNGTRGVTASANFDMNGFGSFQTIHGTGKSLEKKDIANPIAMIEAGAMMVELSLNMPTEANLMRYAVRNVLRKGFRTSDMMHRRNSGIKEVTTGMMKDLMVEELQELGVKENVLV